MFGDERRFSVHPIHAITLLKKIVWWRVFNIDKNILELEGIYEAILELSRPKLTYHINGQLEIFRDSK
jgi:hypothetical protein